MVYQKMKGAAAETGGKAKSVLADLVVYTATIVIALAWNEFWVHVFGEIFGFDTIWILYLYATIMIIMAMLVCYFTGESLSFGEDCC